jgi:two-component sensor histidine kinase
VKTLLLSTAALMLLAGTAFAGPAEDMAKTRIDAIAKGDVAAITSAYADGATLHWVGGPLDGSYAGSDKLKEVWGKFTKAQGEQKATVAAIEAEEGHELLAGEMSHRVKNLLAIASGLTAITSRSTKTTAEMAKELTHRLTALGRAHDLVRPLPGQGGKAALLGDLLTVLLAPYDDLGAFSGRVRVSVPRMGVGEQAATTLALVVHELATNSLKYGALSSPTGTLDIACGAHDTEVVVVWTERGGPQVAAPAGEGGYGSRLLNRSMTLQLGGSISCDWSAEGVIVTLHMTKDRLAH